MAIVCTGLSPTSLEWCFGKRNLPGVRDRIYFIPKRDIVAWPTLPDTFVDNMGELATYVGDFELADGKKWHPMDILVEKSPVTSESQGAKPSKSSLNKATFIHPGTEEEATGFCSLANNDDYVYIVQTKPGKYRVIGNEMYQTETNPSQNLGSSATDEMGTTLEVSVTDFTPAPFYNGIIETDDGDINAPIIP
ncbi:hypothetical protein SAMD00024442_6_23 [Candidatus Symbiothrix dinenymphae]|nr:hypothetical protein SAMD00024442_6_23 [Candidatus Symbiothrix dinenymphae]